MLDMLGRNRCQWSLLHHKPADQAVPVPTASASCVPRQVAAVQRWPKVRLLLMQTQLQYDTRLSAWFRGWSRLWRTDFRDLYSAPAWRRSHFPAFANDIISPPLYFVNCIVCTPPTPDPTCPLHVAFKLLCHGRSHRALLPRGARLLVAFFHPKVTTFHSVTLSSHHHTCDASKPFPNPFPHLQ